MTKRIPGTHRADSNTEHNSGCYLLILQLEKSAILSVGALGETRFKRGFYVYVGRALRNLRQRASRHVRGDGKTKWHVDYLRRTAGVRGVLLSPALDECAVSAEIGKLPGATTIPRFGSSDCNCKGHLVYFQELPDFQNHTHFRNWIQLILENQECGGERIDRLQLDSKSHAKGSFNDM